MSIGIPFFNAQDTLPDAIRSIFAQTFQDWELFLINDGSTDNSLQIAQAVKDTRVRVLNDGFNRGLAFRLNQIIGMASGKYLARMDADDLSHPSRLQRQIEYLDASPKIRLVDTTMISLGEHGYPNGIRRPPPLDTRPRTVLSRGLMHHPTILGETEWFQHNPYDESYLRAEDYELWCRTCPQQVFGHLNESLYFYREGIAPNYLDNYLATSRMLRRVFRVYGPPHIGLFDTSYLILRAYAKDTLYRFFAMMGKYHWLVRQRNRPLSAQEVTDTIKIMKVIAETQVPGLSSRYDTSKFMGVF